MTAISIVLLWPLTTSNTILVALESDRIGTQNTKSPCHNQHLHSGLYLHRPNSFMHQCEQKNSPYDIHKDQEICGYRWLTLNSQLNTMQALFVNWINPQYLVARGASKARRAPAWWNSRSVRQGRDCGRRLHCTQCCHCESPLSPHSLPAKQEVARH